MVRRDHTQRRVKARESVVGDRAGVFYDRRVFPISGRRQVLFLRHLRTPLLSSRRRYTLPTIHDLAKYYHHHSINSAIAAQPSRIPAEHRAWLTSRYGAEGFWY